MIRVWPALALLLLAPDVLVAQGLVGAVRDQATLQPIPGAMVSLIQGDLSTGRLFLTGQDGRFQLRTPGPGVYRVRVERIGFARTESDPVVIEEGQTRTQDVYVGSEAIRLEGIDVSAGPRQCSLRGDDVGATQTLWDEARKALDAARWTEREAGLRFQVVQRTRSLDAGGRRVENEDRNVATVFGGNPVRTLPPENLAEGGYVREVEGFIHYYGPDAAVLLSDAFLNTHCFRIVDGPEGETHLVGLEFEPVGTRNPDIEGVLWMDRATARLERVEFRYTGLGRRPGTDQARGQVRFAELSDGRWIVRDWWIRAPLLGLSRQWVAGERRDRVMVTGVQETGSEVVSASGRLVSWHADVAWGHVEGVVWDSVSGTALADAEVALGGRIRLTRSDARGRFQLDDVAPGTYWLRFDHPVLDTLGVDPLWQEVIVRPDSVTHVDLGVPSRMSILALRCPGGAVVVGTVTDGEGGVGVPGAALTAAGADDGDAGPLTATTTPEGHYWLCGPRRTGTLRLMARLGTLASESVEVETREDGFVSRDLVLSLSPGTRAQGAVGDGRAVLVGTVVDAASGAPVEGASVRLVADDGEVVGQALSDPTGRVILVPDRSGTFALEAQRLGYAPSRGEALDLFRGTRRVEIRLATEAIPVEEMVVSVRGRFPALERNGFYQREERGLGVMLDRDAIDALAPVQAGDVLRRQRGVTVGPSSRGNTTRRFFVFRRSTLAHDYCLPVVYLDGAMVRQGGPMDDPDTEERPSLDELIPAQDIEAVEVYDTASEIPVQFMGSGSACGVVVIWTRTGIGG